MSIIHKLIQAVRLAGYDVEVEGRRTVVVSSKNWQEVLDTQEFLSKCRRGEYTGWNLEITEKIA